MWNPQWHRSFFGAQNGKAVNSLRFISLLRKVPHPGSITMTSQEEVKPGHYWARHNDNVDKHGIAKSLIWRPVEVIKSGPGGELRVWEIACNQSFPLECFDFGSQLKRMWV